MNSDGILLVDKPDGWTSHDVVAKVRSIIKAGTGQKIKIGHTGTLDPAATGLLVLVVGSYTKRASEYSKLDKVYEAEITLGATSTTDDKEGDIIQTSRSKPAKSAVEAILSQFEGEITQTPPIYSAVKINGQRAYKAARAGQTVEIEPRKVTIYSITDVEYAYPTLKFTCEVSSGTYIRSLAVDIGKELGTGAYLSALRRTQVGKYSLSTAMEMPELSIEQIQEHLAN